MCEVDAVIMASGQSKRMGGNKLLFPYKDTTILDHFLRRFPFTLFHEVLMVVAQKEVECIGRRYPLTICRNTSSALGKSQSIKEGVAASRAKEGVMFFVADQPLLTPLTITLLVEAFKEQPQRIVVPRVRGKNGNPVIFPAWCRDDLLALSADQGGRDLFENNREAILHVEFENDREFCDLDTYEQYRNMVNR